MRKIFALILFFITVFARTEVLENDDKRQELKCATLFVKYKHTQKSVANFNGYTAYKPFIKIAERSFVIPGLDESFVPQGIAFSESINSFMISGYCDKGGAAHILTVDYSSGRINGEYKILKNDGTDFTGHCGGIAVYGRYVYIVDGNNLYYIESQKFICKGSGKVLIDGGIKLPCAASYISVYDGYLWAGNFYHKSFAANYDISVFDKYNKLYRAAIVGYRFNNLYDGLIRTDKDTVENTAIPFVVLCAPGQVQGLAFLSNGDVHLSSSYGRNVMSMQRLYEYPLKKECDAMIKIGRKEVPAWFLNDDFLKRSVTTFPMSEGVVSRNGKIYIIFESGAKKYRDTATDATDCVWEMKWE